MWHIHTTEYYSAAKKKKKMEEEKNAICSYMQHLLSEVSKTQKDKSYMRLLIVSEWKSVSPV